jgi:hypothetical protein
MFTNFFLGIALRKSQFSVFVIPAPQPLPSVAFHRQLAVTVEEATWHAGMTSYA